MFVRQDDDDENDRASVAARFWIRCKDERRLSREEREQFLQWTKQSPENVACWLEMFNVAQQLDRLKLLDRETRLSAATASQYGVPLSRRLLLVGGVAAIPLVAGLSIFALRDGEPPIQHVPLADGSVAHVLRGSDFSVEFSDDVRLINLPHGEAVFEVTKDPNRPFVVRSRASDTIAVGTRFGVTSTSSEATTTVAEGEVRVVVPAGGDRNTGTSLHAGQELRVLTGAPQPASVVAVDAERRISWAAGWLEFAGEPVGHAVSEFNRYSDVRIEITQAELSSARLKYGRFEIDKPASFADAVGAAVNAPVTRNPKRNVIYIGERPE